MKIQMVVEEEAKIDPKFVDSIWVVTQREAMVIKGINIPKDLAGKYKALQNPPEQTAASQEQTDGM